MFVFVQCAVLILGLTLFRPSHTNAQPPQQYSIMDKVAAKIIAKYQNSTCNDLYQQKAQKAPPSPEEKKVVEFLHNDPQMRAAFINKVAAPIANKLFECGLIP
jgi:replication initiation and membrane attachment protein DnaB